MAISKTSSRSSKKQADTSHTVFETVPKAALLMLFSGLFILFISTLFTLNLPSPVAFARPIALSSLFIGAAIGGFFCSKRIDAPSSFACGALAVLLLVILLIIAKALIPATVSSIDASFSVIGYLLTAGSAMAGVLLGSKAQKRKRRKKHYRS